MRIERKGCYSLFEALKSVDYCTVLLLVFFNKIKNKNTFFHEWFGLSTFVYNECKKELINNITDLMIREQLCQELKKMLIVFCTVMKAMKVNQD